ncbi:MAG: hypothetical protein AB1659_03945 [Thermodesulfobacteriota bacterium]
MSKVSIKEFSRPWTRGATLKDFLERLPEILAGEEIREVISAVARAYLKNKIVLFGMGAHVIKVGLSPLVVDLMERGVVSAVAMNGAGIIHDAEIAMAGKTSEDVGSNLGKGRFGMSRETVDFLNKAIRKAERRTCGLGQAVGEAIIENKLPFQQFSILAAGVRLKIPVTVHVAFGTDILHIHPGFDPRSTGKATHLDFRLFASVVAALEAGVYFNVGSAVILPEVFLKALTLVRNLGHTVRSFTTVNMDFMKHYRPLTNVVTRPTVDGGKGYSLIGHHELMLPLIAAGVIEAIEPSI